ncbi:MAG TPA: HEAT repeat domain-containing protein [Sphingobacteriaceae bacterium]
MELISDFSSEATWPVIMVSVFSVLIIGLVIYIVIYQHFIRLRKARLARWDSIAESLIMEAIFFEKKSTKDPMLDALDILEHEEVRVPKRVDTLMKDRAFRRRMMDKIVAAKRNVSGTASENLSSLFRKLGLDLDILNMLSTSVWYKQATALELIGFMKLASHQHLMGQYVDDQSGLIRMEAQNAILRFSGFEGLHFLTRTRYSLSEWQQIKLLDELSHLPHEDFKGINDWLVSENDTVVILALKLTRIYHRFELFQEVLKCLDHTNPEVRFHAILVLKALPNPDAVPVLVQLFPRETVSNQIEILKVLQDIASDTEIGFLSELLFDPEFDIRKEATRALFKTGPAGKEVLSQYEGADAYPLNRIIAHVREEDR